MSISIKFEYLICSHKWVKISLPVNEFYDLEYTQLEDIEIDSMSLYDDYRDYIDDKEKSVILGIKCTIEDSYQNRESISTISYWDRERKSLLERINYHKGDKRSREIIESQDLDADGEVITLITRYIEKDGVLWPSSNSVHSSSGVSTPCIEEEIKSFVFNGRLYLDMWK